MQLGPIGERAELQPDTTALVDDTRALTWRELAAEITAVAGRFAELAPEPEQRIGVLGENCAETVIAHLAGILTTASSCDLTRALQAKISRARDQLLTFLDHPGRVEVTNNACERALRPAVVQRKVTNGYRAMWAAEGEAAVRTVVDTARLTSGATVFGAVLKTVSA